MEGHMINNRGMSRAGAAMLALGTGALLALAGCSSSSSISSAAGGATGTTASAAPAPPSWVSALGSGVTVVAPETAAPGQDSPGALIAGYIHLLNTKSYKSFCSYLLPANQPDCLALYSSAAPGALAAAMPSLKNARAGYIAIDGTRALVGMTGEACSPLDSPKCVTNNDPAALLNSGKSFDTLWKATMAQANTPNAPHVYSLLPCQKVGGKWYEADH
jgi:hypothetical protein